MRAGRPLQILLLLLALVALALFTLWRWNQTAVVQEATGPDYYDFGQIQQGAVIEFSAKFLTSPSQRPLDALWDWAIKKAPQRWKTYLSDRHPKKRRKAKALAPADLSALKPSLRSPPFVQIAEIVPEQRKEWYDGQPFFVVQFRLDTSKPGSHSGAVTLRSQERQASLPIRVVIREASQPLRRVLITSSPFGAYSTDHGADFEATTELLSRLAPQVDCLRALPSQLQKYHTILLGEDSMSDLSSQQRTNLNAFVERGGRLILSCNAFFGRTVANANDFLAAYGLEVVNRDYGKLVIVTNLAAHPFTRDLGQLTFFRPSQIHLTPNSTAQLLALTDDGQGGFLAAARSPGGGEVFVLGTSLWWAWLGRDTNRVGNVPLLRNLLEGKSGQASLP